MSTVIKPTVGRVVWFREPEHTHLTLAAIIAFVHNDALVNLAVFDQNGNAHARTSIPLVQDGEPTPQLGPYCCWMPYQIGQAAREGMPRPTPTQPTRVPAYELPEMHAGNPDLITDGQTYNADGSLWRLRPANEGGEPVKIIHGYISEAKHPRLWALARAIYGADFEVSFGKPWRDRPHMIYAGNPEVLLAHGYAMPGEGRESGKGEAAEVNFMMFNATLQPTGVEIVP